MGGTALLQPRIVEGLNLTIMWERDLNIEIQAMQNMCWMSENKPNDILRPYSGVLLGLSSSRLVLLRGKFYPFAVYLKDARTHYMYADETSTCFNSVLINGIKVACRSRKDDSYLYIDYLAILRSQVKCWPLKKT